MVERFSFVDEDEGANGYLGYQLVGDAPQAFSITSTGPEAVLRVARALDYETVPQYHLTLVAWDHGSPVALSSSVSITVQLTDVADSAPVFNTSSYSTEVSEATPTGAELLRVLATTRDLPPLDTLTYSITEGDANDVFRLDSDGVLILQGQLDYERLTSHQLLVTARSLANPDLYADVPVTINVINVNDHAPIFGRGAYNVSVLSSAEVGSHLVMVSADDADSGDLGMVRYFIANDTNPEVTRIFELNPDTGEILTLVSLQMLTGNLYQFSVEARDGGMPPEVSRVSVGVSVVEMRGERPVFSMSSYRAQVREGEEGGEVIGVSASDGDTNSSQLSYYIQSGNVAAAFSISSAGQVSTTGPLDRELREMYQLVLVVSDGVSESSATLSVQVLDTNDHAPQFPRSLYVQEVSEGASEGEELLTVVARDQDEGGRGDVTYSLLEHDSPFLIHHSTGTISLRMGRSLDYETTPTNYTLTVVASDQGTPPLNSTTRVIIYVRDENDNSPVFDHTPSSLSLLEDQPPLVPLLQVSALDADSGLNAHVRYGLSGNRCVLEAFGIGEDTGVVYARKGLDREVQERYELEIHASDAGVPPLASSFPLTISVMDVTDDPPVFSRAAYHICINSQRQADSVLGGVLARTRDENATLSYSMSVEEEGREGESLFLLDQETGELSARVSLDPAEQEGVYAFLVEAQHGSLSSSARLVVTITTDTSPRLSPLTVHFSSYAPLLNATPSFLGVVRVLDPSPSLTYSFSLAPSPFFIRELFTINTTSGHLSVFNNATSGLYQLNVSVSVGVEPGGVVGYGEVTVYITLVTNTTLDNSVVVRFLAVDEETFAERWLDNFSMFVSDLLSVPRPHVEVYGLQRSGDSALPPDTAELALAVRSHDYHTYISPDHLRTLLLTRSADFDLSSSLEVESDACESDMCPNLQTCKLRLQFHSQEVSISPSAELNYHAHPFSLSHLCSCPRGYSRDDLCTSELDECEPNPCRLGAECVDLPGDYQCMCPPSTTGKNCTILCPSDACDPCDPNPCLYGGLCEPSSTTATCSACPSPTHARGPNCELISVRVQPGGHLALPTPGSVAAISLSLRFVTVSPTGVLLYSGRYGNPRVDFVAVEMLVGQVNVGVSFGGVATILRTSSEQRLNDGAWHSVDVQIRNRVCAHFIL